jgi:hypothetical protein
VTALVELGYSFGRAEARRLYSGTPGVAFLLELAGSARYHGRQHDWPRDARGYWLGVARELRAIAAELEVAA